MKCPRCPDAALEERQREGVTIDACRTCYGIWLDRGELERLIARASSEYDELERRDWSRPPVETRREAPAPRPYDDGRPRDDDRYRDDGRYRDDDRYRRDEHRYHGKRKKRWFEALEDIFD